MATSCPDCSGRVFALDRAFDSHRETVHQDESIKAIEPSAWRREPHMFEGGASLCERCNLPRSAKIHW